MNKSELVAALSEKAGVSKKDAEAVLDAFVGTVTEAVANGGSVDLIGFGSFQRAMQKGKEGVVPGTDKKYTTEDKFVPKFKVGKKFKDAVEAGK